MKKKKMKNILINTMTPLLHVKLNIYIPNGIGSINREMKHAGYYSVISKSYFQFYGECYMDFKYAHKMKIVCNSYIT